MCWKRSIEGNVIADLWLHRTTALCPGCALQLHFTLGQSGRLQSCGGISYSPQSSDYVDRNSLLPKRKAESPHSIRKSVDRTTATNGRNGPETSTFKSQVSHESWPTIWYRFLVFYSQRGHEGFNVQPKSSICFHHGAAEVVLRKMPRKMPRRP